jgi:hypothetical protein
MAEADKTKSTGTSSSLYTTKRFYVYNGITRRNEFKTLNLSKFVDLDKLNEAGKEWVERRKKEIQDQKDTLNQKVELSVTPFEFELDEVSGLSIMMIGSTRSGKSTALNHIMDNYYMPKENKFINVLFSNSLQSGVYDQYKDKKNVATSILYQPKVIKECYKINKDTKNYYKFNIILDDIVDKKYDKELMKILTIYRNSRISCIITAQNVTIMNSIGRGNINHIFLFKLNSDEAIEKAVKAYLNSYFPSSFKMVDKIKKYKEMTEDHTFFWINNLTGDIKRTKIII